MTEFSADGLIARLAPGVIDRFQGRGAVDFRVPPGEPDKLRVSILFSRGCDPWEALEDLKDVAERAGLPVADGEATEHGVSIAIPALRYVHKVAEPRGAVAWAAAAALVMSGDVRERSYLGIPHGQDPCRSAHTRFRPASAVSALLRSVLLWTNLLQPAGAK